MSVERVEPDRLVIEAGRAGRAYRADLWRFRELFLVLAWRDISVRYKQSAIGILWAVVRPLLAMVVFTVIFGRLAGLPSAGVPYPVMVYAGMLPWFLFATILGDASQSLVANANLIRKVYYPRLITPVASALVAVVDFAISLAILAALMVFYAVVPDWKVVFLPFFVLLALLTALGPALLFAALNVSYRDFRFNVPFVVQFGLYISPVGFSSAVVPAEWLWLYSLNPMVFVIDGFRWCLLGDADPLPALSALIGLAVTAATLVLGLTVFRRTERGFSDVI